MSHKPRQRYMYTACVCIAAVSIVGLLATTLRTMDQSPLYPLIDHERDDGLAPPLCPQIPIQTHNHLDPMNYLNGPPTERFRGLLYFSMNLNALVEDIYLSIKDNLRLDTKYITSWISAGWSTYRLTIALCIPQLIFFISKRCYDLCKEIRRLFLCPSIKFCLLDEPDIFGLPHQSYSSHWHVHSVSHWRAYSTNRC